MGGSGDRGGEQFERSLGDEVVSDPAAKGFGGSGVSSFGIDLNHGFPIGRDDLGEHTPLPCFAGGWHAVGTNGERAPAAEDVEGGAFGFDREASVGMFEEGDGVADVSIAGFVNWVRTAAGLKSEGSLAGRRTDLFRRKAVVDRLGALEAVEAGGGEDQCIALSVRQFIEASINVAPYFDEGDIGAEGENLRATARARGANAPSSGESVECPVLLADPDVASVGTFGDSGENELRG